MAFQFPKSLRVYNQILDRDDFRVNFLGKNTYSSKNISKLYYSYKGLFFCATLAWVHARLSLQSCPTLSDTVIPVHEISGQECWIFTAKRLYKLTQKDSV